MRKLFSAANKGKGLWLSCPPYTELGYQDCIQSVDTAQGDGPSGHPGVERSLIPYQPVDNARFPF